MFGDNFLRPFAANNSFAKPLAGYDKNLLAALASPPQTDEPLPRLDRDRPPATRQPESSIPQLAVSPFYTGRPEGSPQPATPSPAVSGGPSDLYGFVRKAEGYNPKAYWDHKQWSIGYGTKASGPGEVIDRTEADRRLQAEVDAAGAHVDRAFPGLTPNQRGALTSFTYNLGPGWITQPSRLAAAVRAGDWDATARIMQEYRNASGQPNPGLIKRRAREANWLLGYAE